MGENDETGGELTSQLRARRRQLPEDDIVFVPQRAQAEAPGKVMPRLSLPRKRETVQGTRARKSRSHGQFKHLDEHWLAETKAGASDADLARWSGVPKAVVIRWRRDRGIHRRVTKKRTKVAHALNLFGTDHEDVLHRTDDSPIAGVFDIPEYVIRNPLAYSETARHLWFLQKKLGSSNKLLSQAFGIRESDVKTALAMWENFLHAHGRPCDHCGVRCIKTDRYCSVECWDGARKHYEETL